MRAHRWKAQSRPVTAAAAAAALLLALMPGAAAAHESALSPRAAGLATSLVAPTTPLTQGQTPQPSNAVLRPLDEDPAHTVPPPTEPEDHAWAWAGIAALLLGIMLTLWLRDRSRRKGTE